MNNKIYINDKYKCYNFLDDFSKITLKNISIKSKVDYANVKNKKASDQKTIEFINYIVYELKELLNKYNIRSGSEDQDQDE